MTRTRHNHTIQARRGAWAINRCSLSFFVLSFFTQLRNYSQNILRISPHLTWMDLTGQRDLNLVEPSCRLCSGTLSFDNPLAPSLCSRSHHPTYIIYFAPTPTYHTLPKAVCFWLHHCPDNHVKFHALDDKGFSFRPSVSLSLDYCLCIALLRA